MKFIEKMRELQEHADEAASYDSGFSVREWSARCMRLKSELVRALPAILDALEAAEDVRAYPERFESFRKLDAKLRALDALVEKE